MIIALKRNVRAEEQEHLIEWLEDQGVRTHISEGEFQTIIGLVGDTTRIDTDLISGLAFVEGVTRISEPFKRQTANSIRRTRLSGCREARPLSAEVRFS